MTFTQGPFRRPQGPRRVPSWRRRLKTNAMLADAIAIYVAVITAYFVRWGMGEVFYLNPWQLTNRMAFFALFLLLAWFAALAIADAWDTKIMGAGSAEYVRVSNATLAVFGLVAIVSYLIRGDFARSYVAIALPLGLVFLNFSHWAMRQTLVKDRSMGYKMQKALMIGSPASVAQLTAQLTRVPAAGLEIVAVCTPTPSVILRPEGNAGSQPAPPSAKQIDQLTSLDDVVPYVEQHNLDAVIVSGTDEINPRVLKRLTWSLEPHHIDLILAPELMDVAGARLVTRTIAGVPLLHVEEPGYTSRQQHLKRIFDLIGSTILIIIFAIPMLIVALLIRITSPGPVIFKQTRIGIDGKEFQVFKFRTMVVDAEAKFDSVMGNNIGFINKVKNDPRITPLGRFLRRFSIDELPQLFNVWLGEMSLVGPRPPLVKEAKLYSDGIERRLFVRPGMTGLWQVSGRSNLSPAEAMRLDLYYIENWSITEDMLILARTAKAVLGRDGAY